MKKYKQAAVLLTAVFLILCAGCRTAEEPPQISAAAEPTEGPRVEGLTFTKRDRNSTAYWILQQGTDLQAEITEMAPDGSMSVQITNTRKQSMEYDSRWVMFCHEDDWYEIGIDIPEEERTISTMEGHVKTQEQLARDVIQPGETHTFDFPPLGTDFIDSVTLLPGIYRCVFVFWPTDEIVHSMRYHAVAEFTLEWE